MPNELISVRIPDGKGYGLSDIEAKAKKIGITKSEFVMKSIDMMMNFDETFFKKIVEISKEYKAPEWLIIQSLLIKKFADQEAQDQVFGKPDLILNDLIAFGEPNKLFNYLKNEYVQKYELQLAEQLVIDEAMGSKLSEEQKSLLIKHHKGNAWLESNEYRKEQELRAKYADVFAKNKELRKSDRGDE